MLSTKFAWGVDQRKFQSRENSSSAGQLHRKKEKMDSEEKRDMMGLRFIKTDHIKKNFEKRKKLKDAVTFSNGFATGFQYQFQHKDSNPNILQKDSSKFLVSKKKALTDREKLEFADFKKKKKKQLIANEKTRSMRDKEMTKERIRKNLERLENKKYSHPINIMVNPSKTQKLEFSNKKKEMSRCKSSMDLYGPNAKYNSNTNWVHNNGYDDFGGGGARSGGHLNFDISGDVENEKFEKIYQDYKKMVEGKPRPGIASNNGLAVLDQNKMDMNSRKIYLEEKFKKLTKKIEDNFGKPQLGTSKKLHSKQKENKKQQGDGHIYRQKITNLNKTPDTYHMMHLDHPSSQKQKRDELALGQTNYIAHIVDKNHKKDKSNMGLSDNMNSSKEHREHKSSAKENHKQHQFNANTSKHERSHKDL